MSTAIVNHRIAGTRISVFDVYYYLVNDETPDSICAILRITPEQYQAAIDYIEAHKAEVVAVHERLEARNARGNPPELQAKLDAAHAAFLERVRQRRAEQLEEHSGAGHPLRQ